ncbi:MAG: CDP-2,3-bis-(O-geranylgeranyl)-sn-glycerol synthase [Candidatus Iainarchaeum archaeon]|uniref:CDP-archaeol synthase n=1 Tax=Candidatus Iainarchaeum sp. TaxID=3101447 RepID=A0A7T9I2K8_9ARCH|nr:MAG: CDP-2,3-bis-(O-geranylgeranyl)-sn-glycerol synthase [Candidatus Diapherotrites archaeon]
MLTLMLYVALTAAPMYVANASAMIFGGKTPLDGGKHFWDGKPLLGKGKTWKGTLMGILTGTFAGLLIWNFFPEQALLLTPYYPSYSFLLALGAIAGDIVGSFLKRRMDIERGKQAPLLDQLDFVIGGLVLGLVYFQPDIIQVLVLALITPLVHSLANRLAFTLKLKNVPW